MKLPQPFVQLPFWFDPVRLNEELASLQGRHWLPHPSGMPGNTSLPLISRMGGDNDHFDGPMRETPHLAASPYLRQCLHHIGQVYGRSRLMALEPGARVQQHVDFNYHWHTRVRIHVPIATTPEVMFHCGDDSVHMEAGSCWIFDSWRHHRVVNNGPHRRTHLVVDTTGSSAFWRTVDDSIKHGTRVPSSPLPFDASLRPVLQTEQYNSMPVMAPGELQSLAADLLDDLAANPQNNARELDTLRVTLNDFVHDWRVLWSRYGQSSAGFGDYQQLLQATVSRLPAEPRALTTASNDVGAVSIAMQRMIRAALRPDLQETFLQTPHDRQRSHES